MTAKEPPDLAAIARGHMPVMDGWRGLAILVVVMHNAGFILSDYPSYGSTSEAVVTTVLSSGWVGVQLFFVLSGFLITGILLDTRGSPNYFRSFYVRRALRIFPLYYAYLLGVLGLTGLGFVWWSAEFNMFFSLLIGHILP